MKLYDYQEKYLATLPASCIMAADTGTGKTFMSLAHYQKWASGTPLLILAPASKARTGDWQREITEFFGAGNEPEYKIYSYEKFSRIPSDKQFKEGKRAIWHKYAVDFGGTTHAIIADEVHKIKNPQSNTGKALYHSAKYSTFFVGLSATPIANGWIDAANYFKIFGFTKGITEFKKRYCNIQSYKGWPEIIGYWRENELKDRWNNISRQLLRENALDLPSRTFIGVNFTKPPEYTKLILERISTSGDMIDNASQLVHAIRQTLTPGKLDYLSDLIDGTDENIIIFYNYISEREVILDMLKRKHKGRKVYRLDGEKHQMPARSSWSTLKNTITLAHYKSGGTGIELTYAPITIYFSPTYSYIEYVQSLGRNYRIGQSKKVVIYNFCTTNTIEREVYQALREKRDFSEKLWRADE